MVHDVLFEAPSSRHFQRECGRVILHRPTGSGAPGGVGQGLATLILLPFLPARSTSRA
jgi:hypothetical protein